MSLVYIKNNKPLHDEESGVVIKEGRKVKLPKKYKVIMHNDDYTTMEFVILVLKKFFKKTDEEAELIMWKIHNEGFGICGVYTLEVAESKSSQVVRFARESGHPLKCTIDPE